MTVIRETGIFERSKELLFISPPEEILSASFNKNILLCLFQRDDLDQKLTDISSGAIINGSQITAQGLDNRHTIKNLFGVSKIFMIPQGTNLRTISLDWPKEKDALIDTLYELVDRDPAFRIAVQKTIGISLLNTDGLFEHFSQKSSFSEYEERLRDIGIHACVNREAQLSFDTEIERKEFFKTLVKMIVDLSFEEDRQNELSSRLSQLALNYSESLSHKGYGDGFTLWNQTYLKPERAFEIGRIVDTPLEYRIRQQKQQIQSPAPKTSNKASLRIVR